MMHLAERLFAERDDARYLAVLRGGALRQESRPGRADTAVTESDRYEELLVNPLLLEATTRRGAIDCGGLRFVVVRYGRFYQVIMPINDGHVSIAVDPDGDPLAVAAAAQNMFR